MRPRERNRGLDELIAPPPSERAELVAVSGRGKLIVQDAGPRATSLALPNGTRNKLRIGRSFFVGTVAKGMEHVQEELWDANITISASSRKINGAIEYGSGRFTVAGRVFIAQRERNDSKMVTMIVGVTAENILYPDSNKLEQWKAKFTITPVRRYHAKDLGGLDADQLLISEQFAFPERHLKMIAGQRCAHDPSNKTLLR